jgi:hypothetical protein
MVQGMLSGVYGIGFAFWIYGVSLVKSIACPPKEKFFQIKKKIFLFLKELSPDYFRS